MKRKILCLIMLFVAAFSLVGCRNKKEKAIIDSTESTVIKNPKSIDEHLKKKDYNSIAYAYIYNIKEGLNSYESKTSGSLKAKVLFIDYNVKYDSLIYKRGSAFYSKDNSTSKFADVKNEFYMVDKEKILVSRDLKKYEVFTLDEYKKVSYAMSQYTIMGYVFNDESIIESNLVSNENGTVSIKYTLDNKLATNIVKVDLKQNGGLSSYPSFKKIEITLTMKKDYTPISYAINSIYNASKPFIGSAKVTQVGECVFSKINENVTIPGEDALIEKLGAEPSEINNDNKELSVKEELFNALMNLDLANGVNAKGNISLNLFDGEPINIFVDSNTALDLKSISSDNIYSALKSYTNIEVDDSLSSLLSLIKLFAGDKLGEYEPLFDDLKNLEIIYDANGGIYFIPANSSGLKKNVVKVKATDILDMIFNKIDRTSVELGPIGDIATFTKRDSDQDENYQVEISLNPDIAEKIKNGINNLLSSDKNSVVKTLLGYKDFDSIKITVGVTDNVLSSIDASFNYLKENTDGDDFVKSLVDVHFDIEKNASFDFNANIKYANDIYKTYTGVSKLRSRLEEFTNNVYASRMYLSTLENTYAEYEALTEQEKIFVGIELGDKARNLIDDVKNVLNFIEVINKYDLYNLSNEDIYYIAKAYDSTAIDSSILKAEIGQGKYEIVSDLGSYVDYSSLESIKNKIKEKDEMMWNLTEAEIRAVKTIIDIAEYDSSVDMRLFVFAYSTPVSREDFKEKIIALYNKL